jgi:3'(2'), 5'-bisphosphate nucleotidase
MIEIDNFVIKQLIDVVYCAGEEIIKIYDSDDFDISIKTDHSPLTKADVASNNIITKALHKIKLNNSFLPVISEESKNISYEERKSFNYYWLVDPLDGTKEFIKRNGEFTVNIALMENNFPIFGIIYAPVSRQIYYGAKGNGSFRISGDLREQIKVSQTNSKPLSIVKSRSHSSEAEDKFYSNFNIGEINAIGSSLKFCLIAEGKSDLYFRSGPTMEWDTAAGQAIVESAGGVVVSEGKRMEYNKESLKNSSFIVSSFDDRLFYEQ